MEYLLTSLTHEVNHSTFILLTRYTFQVCRLKWTDPSQHLKGFSFLFFQFKIFYLVCLYKNFRSAAGLYSPPPPISKDNQLLCLISLSFRITITARCSHTP